MYLHPEDLARYTTPHALCILQSTVEPHLIISIVHIIFHFLCICTYYPHIQFIYFTTCISTYCTSYYTHCIYIFTFFRSHCEIQEHQLKMKMFESEEAKRNGSELHAVSGKPVVPPPLPVAVGDNVVLREVWQEQARLLIKQV